MNCIFFFGLLLGIVLVMIVCVCVVEEFVVVLVVSEVLVLVQVSLVKVDLVLLVVIVYKIVSCGCCGIWVDYLKVVGFEVDVCDIDDMNLIKVCLGVLVGKVFCYIVEIGGYVVEGYILVEDIKCLLVECLVVCGLVLFGMLVGLLGMEMLDGYVQLYIVELVCIDGSIELFVQYGQGG